MVRATANKVLFGILVIQLMLYSVFAEQNQLNRHQDQELLKTFLDAKRRTKRAAVIGDASDITRDPAILNCIQRVEELTEDGKVEKERQDYLSTCLAECIVMAKSPVTLDEEDFDDPECVELGYEARDMSTGVQLTERKWRPFKKIGAWFRKNKDKIVKGLATAGRIIGGVIKAIGK